MCATWRSTISSAPRRSASKPAASSVPLAAACASGSSSAATAPSAALLVRQTLGGDLADRVVLLAHQLGHVAVAGLGHAREQLVLLELEMAPDVVLDQPRE